MKVTMAEGGMNRRTWAALLIIVLGVSYHAYQLVQIQEQIKIESAAIENIALEGELLEGLPIPSHATFDFVLSVNNPTPYVLEAEKVAYSVDINEARLLDGSLGSLEIEGMTAIRIPVRVSLEQAADTAIDAILSEGMEIRVSGAINVPLKLFGVHKLLTVSVPFEKTEFVPVDAIGALEGYIDQALGLA
jgi:LEA14-like dessication related protein